MPIVTSLKPQKDNKRVNVYLDNKFAFGIDLDNLVRFGIKVEKEFSKEEIDKIIHEAEFHKIFSKLLNFATLRPRSKYELFLWLKRKKAPESIHKRLFSKLKRLDLVNDYKFAEWWIGQRVEFKFKSKKEIKYELMQKGVDKKIIDNALGESEIDEQKLAGELLKKNEYKWKKYDTPKQKERASAFLARKGFNWDVIKNVVQYDKENDDV